MGALFDRPGTFLLILLAIILFGYKRLPDAARSVGRSIRIFKSEMEANDSKKTNSSDNE